jgi:hypothetical protein
MMTKHKKLSRRDFLVKTALFTAGSLMGTNRLWEPLAQALPNGSEQKVPDLRTENPRIAIIIDDVGYSISRVMPFFELGVPVTFSILPQVLFSCRLAEKIHSEGHEIMLHQPMEPYNAMIDPGPGALYLYQTSEEVLQTIEENISSFPFAIGVNNHMGSHFTESKKKTEQALKVFREKNLFFIDSFTTSDSIAYATAMELEMTAAYRNVFLDNLPDKSYICSQFIKLRDRALRVGHAIGIGHPRPETVSVLKEFLDDLKGTGISVTYASEIASAYPSTLSTISGPASSG